MFYIINSKENLQTREISYSVTRHYEYISEELFKDILFLHYDDITYRSIFKYRWVGVSHKYEMGLSAIIYNDSVPHSKYKDSYIYDDCVNEYKKTLRDSRIEYLLEE